MMKKELSEIERSRRERQRAMSLNQFCERYNIGRTKVYEQIKQRRLKARKCGARTIIAEDDAEEWFNSLPQVENPCHNNNLRGCRNGGREITR
jgi:hypothetical protein